MALGWNGNDKFSNADISGHAAAALAALTGNSGHPGAGVGVYTYGASYHNDFSLASWPLPEGDTYIRTKHAYNMIAQGMNIHAYISVGDTLQQAFADFNQTLEWAKSLDFLLCCDIYATTTTTLADIILPCCTKFENDEPYGRLRKGYNHLSLETKVLDPLFDSRTDFRVMQTICKRNPGIDSKPPARGSYRVRAAILGPQQRIVLGMRTGTRPPFGRTEVHRRAPALLHRANARKGGGRAGHGLLCAPVRACLGSAAAGHGGSEPGSADFAKRSRGEVSL